MSKLAFSQPITIGIGNPMQTKSSIYYDAVYTSLGKDYAHEVSLLLPIIRQHKRAPGHELLDVACGTGGHSKHLREHFEVSGLDLDTGMLEVARHNCPGIPFYEGDMATFNLGREFDVVVCLFSAIGYVLSVDRLNQTLLNFARHLRSGGALVVEPWLEPADMRPGYVNASFVDQPDFKLARMNVARIENNISILDFNFMIATPSGVEYFTERHDLYLFTQTEYMTAFESAGLATHFEAPGLTGRGLYIGVRP
jgi:ubiquinone/menaquinone biosynthesis C-methylase UbiE